MQIDRTSCYDLKANTFGVPMTTFAYILFQAGCDCNADRTLRWGQVTALREGLFKIAVWVKITCRRIYISQPEAFPDVDVFARIAGLLDRL